MYHYTAQGFSEEHHQEAFAKNVRAVEGYAVFENGSFDQEFLKLIMVVQQEDYANALKEPTVLNAISIWPCTSLRSVARYGADDDFSKDSENMEKTSWDGRFTRAI